MADVAKVVEDVVEFMLAWARPPSSRPQATPAGCPRGSLLEHAAFLWLWAETGQAGEVIHRWPSSLWISALPLALQPVFLLGVAMRG